MLDWNNYRSELMQRLGELGKLTPETMKGVVARATQVTKLTFGRKSARTHCHGVRSHNPLRRLYCFSRRRRCESRCNRR